MNERHPVTQLPALSLPPWAPEFRHVVFKDAMRSSRNVINLAPVGDGTPRIGPIDLTGDEESFLRWLFREGGVDLDKYRLKTLKRRIPSCLRALHAHTLADARRTVERKPALLAVALSNLVIGVTSFFRDPQVFQALATDLLPQLIAGRMSLTVWSIGCSEGAELYSLAMLLAEQNALDRCHLLGTDCRADAVRRAREGLFEVGSLKGLPAVRLHRFFSRVGTKWQVRPELADATHWRKADILSLHEPGVWDIIACRNMAMYMSPEATTELWPRLGASLRPGGLLVLGRAERPTGAPHLSMVGPCIYRRDRG